ncbi:MAG: stage 0 sporulation protein [Candidatus Omnitrophica bacterium CG07_land_8_20_14_0_80_42_15]|uniref:Stage 0 sporulation protein n=1 Tax=Candidatus Aquitaenariimonas noxiae TaxID=1974741 RepID=A0A2J0KUE5_9BACT|nr:MAG: stage 0 sporulation protein [Candidatus Omnitrophica bacterium CG07_land_8_20_14_0_80_42_15]
MYEVVQVRLREAGKISPYSTSGLKFAVGDYVIVSEDRGLEYGQVISEPEALLDADLQTQEPLRKIVRTATHGDIHQIESNKKKIEEVSKTCMRKIQECKLPMKLVEAEYSFDRSKIIFYFTAEGRVDFRELVKDLAHIFKARIELKQIGVRDEAKMLGGLGPCGRQLCCSKFLKNFEAVTIKMAKEQNLPLNPTKISGLCGRLMCCLGYEHECYKELMKGMPREGQKIKVKGVTGKVIGVNALNRTVVVELETGEQVTISCENK